MGSDAGTNDNKPSKNANKWSNKFRLRAGEYPSYAGGARESGDTKGADDWERRAKAFETGAAHIAKGGSSAKDGGR